ncbi:MAG: hypothetical protein HQM03_17460 [Magnetococcales bacterium]|nr:hypothetical protein [Magnetococcales bacterium]
MNKDLLVLTADADAEAIIKSVLARHQSLGVRQIEFEVMRHPMRDPGIFKEGPEFARLFKDKYNFLIIIFDHHGSGCNKSTQECHQSIQSRLDGITWKDRSFSAVISPEIEEWLWFNKHSICHFFNMTETELQLLVGEYSDKHSKDPPKEKPKEVLDYVCYRKLKKNHLLPREYKAIASRASLMDWQNSESFGSLVHQLRSWFPQQ